MSGPFGNPAGCILSVQIVTSISWFVYDIHHPQTKFAKVMFSQVSVCPRGVSAPLHAGIHPWPDTPPGKTSLGRPPMQCMLGYGQQAGGTHPTGMHSCCCLFIN